MPGKKTLVAFHTKTGATGEYAKIIADALRASHGHEVTIIDLKENGKPDVAPYDNVVIGSGVRIGMWYGRANGMLKRDYSGKKVAIFVACGRACDPGERPMALENYINKKINKYPKTSFVGGAVFNGRYGDKLQPTPDEEIKAWADELGKKMG